MPVVDRLVREDRSGIPVWVDDEGTVKTCPRYMVVDHPTGTQVRLTGILPLPAQIFRLGLWNGKHPRWLKRNSFRRPDHREWVSFSAGNYPVGALLEVVEPDGDVPQLQMFDGGK
jgi:hypothetical protein